MSYTGTDKLMENENASKLLMKTGGSGDMTDVKAEFPSSNNGNEQESTSSSEGSSSSSGWWVTTKSDGCVIVDREACTSSSNRFDVGYGDKSSSSCSTSEIISPGMNRSLDDPEAEEDEDGIDEGQLAVSVSQAGKKYVITQRNLIVNYLPQAFTDKQLFNLFASYGAIESVKIMRDATTGYSYGFGFVNFVHDTDGIKARSEMNGIQVENKRIKVSFARPPSDDIKDTNLYVTNLPRSMTEEDLFKLFAPFGEIMQRKLLVDRYTNLPRGVAFIRFEKRDQAAAAIKALNNYVPPGAEEPIRIRLAEDHGKQKAAYLAGFRAGMGLPSGPPGGGHGKPPTLRSNSWNSYSQSQPGGKRSIDAGWKFERRNRAPSCNPIFDGYWTAEGMQVASGPYGYPPGHHGEHQHPFCESNDYSCQRKRKRFR